MKQVLDFLNNAGVYYLATAADNRAHIRPIGFVMEHQGRLTFCTDNRKAMYQQMSANPQVEICCYDGTSTLRISGKAVFCTSAEAQQKALELMPALKHMYSVNDGIFELYYLDSDKAIRSTMQGDLEEWPLSNS